MQINKVAFIGKGGVGLLYGSMIARALGNDAVEYVMDDARFERHAGDALTVNGEPIDNPDKSYGLVGHILVDPDGPRCISGHKGCATCLTDNSIATEYSEMIGHPATFDEFAAAARASKTQATNLVNRTCFRLGTLIATIANLAMPDKIMIAGESSFIAKLGIDNLRNGINMYRHSQAAPVDFEIAEHDWSLWSKAAAAQAIRQYVG